ncbi:putative nucleolar complex protein 4 -like protein [Capsicum annuum]|nr:putative nucleolar complex protein 4 -like protein [Capsicum annuum]
MEPKASNSQTMDNNAINLILARLETMSRDVARLNVDLEKLDMDVASMKQDRPSHPPLHQVQQEGLGTQIPSPNPNPPIQTPLDQRPHYSNPIPPLKAPLNPNRPIHVEGYGRGGQHDVYGSYDNVYLRKERMTSIHGELGREVGLNEDISTRMMLQRFDTIDGIFHVALEVERELKDNSFIATQPEATKVVQKHPPRYEGKLNSTSNLKGFQCFKCKGWGHKASECPNRRNVILREGKLYYLGEEVVIESAKVDGKPQDGEHKEVKMQGEEDVEDVWPCEGDCEAVQLTKFDYRLSNSLDTELQKLRCRINYHALRFTDPIIEMGRKLVERIRKKSKNFLALHLRFESYMLAFSRCYYGGGEKERQELGKIRKRWKKLHARNPDKERKKEKCPLTPEEVGLMLRALSFENDVHIYIASGQIYGGEETLAPLEAFFPNFYIKETLTSKEELALFPSFSSRMASLDFIVCDESDVFVSNNNGNMARMLAGRRFHGRTNGGKTGKGEFHENPSACICEDFNVKAREDATISGNPAVNFAKGSNSVDNGTWRSFREVNDGHISEDEQDGFDTDNIENEG